MNKLMNSKLNSDEFFDFCDNVDNTMAYVEFFTVSKASNKCLLNIIDAWRRGEPKNTHAVKAAMFVLNSRGIRF